MVESLAYFAEMKLFYLTCVDTMSWICYGLYNICICLKYYEMTILSKYLSLNIMFTWRIIILHLQQINPMISKYMVLTVVSYNSKENIHLGHAQTVMLKSTWIFGNLAMMVLKWSFTFKFHLHLKISALLSLWRTFWA